MKELGKLPGILEGGMLPKAGKVSIGMGKAETGEDHPIRVDHFRILDRYYNEKGEPYWAESALQKKLPDKPRELIIFLGSNELSDILWIGRALYSQSGLCKCYCQDGENAYEFVAKQGRRKKKCPGMQCKYAIKGACKGYVQIWFLLSIDITLMQRYTFRSTNKHTINYLHSALIRLRDLSLASVGRVNIAWIPLKLQMLLEKRTAPDGAMQKHWAVTLDIDQKMLMERGFEPTLTGAARYMAQNLLTEDVKPMLTSPPTPIEDGRAIIDEFDPKLVRDDDIEEVQETKDESKQKESLLTKTWHDNYKERALLDRDLAIKLYKQEKIVTKPEDVDTEPFFKNLCSLFDKAIVKQAESDTLMPWDIDTSIDDKIVSPAAPAAPMAPAAPQKPKRRGRPKGSKNKKKRANEIVENARDDYYWRQKFEELASLSREHHKLAEKILDLNLSWKESYERLYKEKEMLI